MDHASIGRNPDGSYYYTHGAFLGHIVPGIFFIIWGTWWLVALFDHFLTTAAFKHQFRTKSWYRVFFGPVWLRRMADRRSAQLPMLFDPVFELGGRQQGRVSRDTCTGNCSRLGSRRLWFALGLERSSMP